MFNELLKPNGSRLEGINAAKAALIRTPSYQYQHEFLYMPTWDEELVSPDPAVYSPGVANCRAIVIHCEDMFGVIDTQFVYRLTYNDGTNSGWQALTFENRFLATLPIVLLTNGSKLINQLEINVDTGGGWPGYGVGGQEFVAWFLTDAVSWSI